MCSGAGLDSRSFLSVIHAVLYSCISPSLRPKISFKIAVSLIRYHAKIKKCTFSIRRTELAKFYRDSILPHEALFGFLSNPLQVKFLFLGSSGISRKFLLMIGPSFILKNATLRICSDTFSYAIWIIASVKKRCTLKIVFVNYQISYEITYEYKLRYH